MGYRYKTGTQSQPVTSVCQKGAAISCRSVEVQEYYSEQNQDCDVGGSKQEACVCKKWMLEPPIRNTGKIKTFLLVQWMHYYSMLFKKKSLTFNQRGYLPLN